jgi:hypothetical protein
VGSKRTPNNGTPFTGTGGGKRREKLPKYKKRKAIQGDILKYESPPPFAPTLQQKFEALLRTRNKENAIPYQNMRVFLFTKFQCEFE